jgi:hypothetical protein
MLAGLRGYHLQQGESCLPSTIQHQAVPPWLPWSPAVSLPPRPYDNTFSFPHRADRRHVTEHRANLWPGAGQSEVGKVPSRHPHSKFSMSNSWTESPLRQPSVVSTKRNSSCSFEVPFLSSETLFLCPPILAAPNGVATQKEDFWKPCLHRKHNHAESCKTPLS